MLVTPDKFKGTLTGKQICQAVISVLGKGESLPLSDGGDGFVSCLEIGEIHKATVLSPYSEEIDAEYRIHGR